MSKRQKTGSVIQSFGIIVLTSLLIVSLAFVGGFGHVEAE